MKRSMIYILVLGVSAAPGASLAHGGRAGGGGGGGWGGAGGGFSHATYHPSYHAPTFSRPSTAAHAAPAGGAARNFAARPGNFAAQPGNFGRSGGIAAPGLAGRNFAGRGYLGGAGLGYRSNYGNWYHGNWQGHWGRPWGAWPVGWGGYWPGSSWGLGLGLGLGVGLGTVGLMAASSPYNWGYYNYSNPYWGGPIAGMPYIDYSQPMVGGQPMMAGQMGPGQMAPGQQMMPGQQMGPGQQPGAAAGLAGDPNGANQQALGVFDGARNLFMQGNYQAALDQVNQALAYAPKDPVINEFRGLCLFAVGNYQQAAATDYAVLSTGPGWDWTTMSSFYPSVDVYTQQLRALEAYSQQHPQAADARFLLAYHYLREGYN
ncbi:MAG TPA: tetratricopeptide repeat protein, partial [Pirellulales bacterium]